MYKRTNVSVTGNDEEHIEEILERGDVLARSMGYRHNDKGNKSALFTAMMRDAEVMSTTAAQSVLNQVKGNVLILVQEENGG